MTMEDQLRYGRIAIVVVITVLLIAAITVAIAYSASAKASDVQQSGVNSLSDTAMWVLGIIGGYALIIAEILRRHDNDLTELKSRQPKVTRELCEANMLILKNELDHGVERFLRVESALDSLEEELKLQANRHKEIMTGIETLMKK